MKLKICTLIGMLGGVISAALGGWDGALATLVTVMAIDYISGLIVAGIFHTSKKSENGALESSAGFKGLFRKGMILLIVLVAYRMDVIIGVAYIRDTVIIGFVANEVISIIENAGLMGIDLPPALKKAIDILTEKSKEGESDE